MADKVLYISHSFEGSGWSQASIDYMLAMDSVGIDVVHRPIVLGKNVRPPKKIQEFMHKSLDGVKTCVQNILPHYMDYKGGIKNVGLPMIETDTVRFTGWYEKLSLMDEVWHPCPLKDKVNENTKTIPIPVNKSKYEKRYIFDIPELKDSYKFYFIGESVRRKNINALLKAYYTHFSNEDNVSLIIKTGGSAQNLAQKLMADSEEIKRAYRMYHNNKYPTVVFLTDRLPEHVLYGLHQFSDCFVCPSFGEAWSIPCMDAVGFNKMVLASNTGALSYYLRQENLIGGRYERCLGADAIFDDLHTGFEKWFSIDCEELGTRMRECYENNVRTNNIDIYPFTYEYVGRMISETV